MTARTLSAAVSHVGRIRANNQDSGYAGQHLFAVADGMGGHAGGDVASALTIAALAHLDRPDHGVTIGDVFRLRDTAADRLRRLLDQQHDLAAGLEGKAAKAIPFRLVLPMAVRQLFNELDLEKDYKEYEEARVTELREKIAAVDESSGMESEVYSEFLRKIYKRSK